MLLARRFPCIHALKCFGLYYHALSSCYAEHILDVVGVCNIKCCYENFLFWKLDFSHVWIIVMRTLILVEPLMWNYVCETVCILVDIFIVVTLKSSKELLYLKMRYMSIYEQPKLLLFTLKLEEQYLKNLLPQLTTNNLAEQKLSDELSYCRKTGKYSPPFVNKISYPCIFFFIVKIIFPYLIYTSGEKKKKHPVSFRLSLLLIWVIYFHVWYSCCYWLVGFWD